MRQSNAEHVRSGRTVHPASGAAARPKAPLSAEHVAAERFAHLRQHAEWFAPGDDLLAFIKGLVR